MKVRLFASFQFAEDVTASPDWIAKAYAQGVPMGGDLPKAPDGGVPTLLLLAMKEPGGANLDRIQVVKGWVDAKGALHEKIYDVALSGDRKPGPDGSIPAVGNTVDVATASYSNTIGDTMLSASWRDPDFDRSCPAVYYARVLQIPTPRWSTYDAAKVGVTPPALVSTSIQERAWTSPIWYKP